MSKDPKLVFIERLKKARQAKGLNQAELAKKARLAPSAISHFENGARRPSFANLMRLADALDVSTDYLLGREVDTPVEADAIFRHMSNMSATGRKLLMNMAEELANPKGEDE